MDLAPLILACAPFVSPDTMTRYIGQRSQADPLAIHITETDRWIRPKDQAEAIAAATKLVEDGIGIEVGLAQINSAEWAEYDLTPETVFDPCKNLAAPDVCRSLQLRLTANRSGQAQRRKQASRRSPASCARWRRISAVLVDSVLAPGLDDLESRRARHGYNARVLALAHELNIRQAEVRSFLRGTLPLGLTEEIQKQLRPRGFRHDIPPHRERPGDHEPCSFSSSASNSMGWPSCS